MGPAVSSLPKRCGVAPATRWLAQALRFGWIPLRCAPAPWATSTRTTAPRCPMTPSHSIPAICGAMTALSNRASRRSTLTSGSQPRTRWTSTPNPSGPTPAPIPTCSPRKPRFSPGRMRTGKRPRITTRLTAIAITPIAGATSPPSRTTPTGSPRTRRPISGPSLPLGC